MLLPQNTSRRLEIYETVFIRSWTVVEKVRDKCVIPASHLSSVEFPIVISPLENIIFPSKIPDDNTGASEMREIMNTYW
jgi:hypothetical protein